MLFLDLCEVVLVLEVGSIIYYDYDLMNYVIVFLLIELFLLLVFLILYVIVLIWFVVEVIFYV